MAFAKFFNALPQTFTQTRPMGRHNAFSGSHRGFHTSVFVSSGLSRHNTHPSVPINLSQNDTRPYWIPGETLPEASQFL